MHLEQVHTKSGSFLRIMWPHLAQMCLPWRWLTITLKLASSTQYGQRIESGDIIMLTGKNKGGAEHNLTHVPNSALMESSPDYRLASCSLRIT
jgi:hypothetical protein